MLGVFVNVTAIGGQSGKWRIQEIEKIKKALEPLGYHVFMTGTKAGQPMDLMGMSQSWGAPGELSAEFLDEIKTLYQEAGGDA